MTIYNEWYSHRFPIRVVITIKLSNLFKTTQQQENH